MNKGLIALAMSIGILFGTNGEMPRGGKIEQAIILREIDKTRRFNMYKFQKYWVKSDMKFQDLDKGEVTCKYDLDDSWISDITAIFGFNAKIVPVNQDIRVENYARRVYIDKDENGYAEIGYFDKNDDGYLETKEKYRNGALKIIEGDKNGKI